VIIDVLANDTTGDTPVPATVQIVGTDNPGEELVVPGEGTWTVNPTTGAITFTPEVGFTGDPAPIEYTVQDAEGNTSDPAEVVVTFTVAPLANNDVNLGNVPGTAVSLDVPATTWPRPAARSTRAAWTSIRRRPASRRR
jgi:large repetitive protein